MTDKRCSIDSCGSYSLRIDGKAIFHSCKSCGRYRHPACGDTGEVIKYPWTGPVGSRCPLQKYQHPDEEGAA